MSMIFENARFIKPGAPFVMEYREEDLAPMFRRVFHMNSAKTANLSVCAMGSGCFWLNGQKITDDLMITAASDYDRTLWYNVYDVASLLVDGENIIACICGNGWYNETLKTPWGHDASPWRDNPKFILQLIADDEIVLVSDSSWKCSDKSPTFFNQLRSGEYFDARLYDKNWNTLNYDDSSWPDATEDAHPPKGLFREYACEPIRVCAEYPTRKIIKTDDGRCIFDIGQNISGYIRLKIRQKAGDIITIRYAEQICEDNTLNLNGMEKFYPISPFQTDRFVCSGEDFTWSPMFVYHGFRYIELSGVAFPEPEMVTGLFIHLDVPFTSGFECSNEYLNKLFHIGRMATLSNLQHIPTDCPTREKLGWANDAQASAEQMIMNFGTKKFFEKWMVDIVDSIRPDGAIPGIIPTGGWGYEWGTGPVSSGILFEIPYKIYLYAGDEAPLKNSLPVFIRHLAYIAGRAEPDGLINYGLSDWAGPFDNLDGPPTPVKFTDSVLYVKFLRISLLAANLRDERKEAATLELELNRMTALIKKTYLAADGTCTIHEQTAVSMLIYHDIYDFLPPLAAQLKKTVEEHQFHHNCGMVGLRHLYYALDKCSLQEYAYRIMTAQGYPSYSPWIDGDATTLWETWQPGNSKNHHMYSDFMLWLMHTLVGISPVMDAPGFKKVAISPAFLPQIDFCKGYADTVHGRIEVEWKREMDGISVRVVIPLGVQGIWNGHCLESGIHMFLVS